MRELCEAMQMQFLVGQVTGFEEQDGRLASIKVTGGDAVTRSVPLDMLLVFFGLSPKLGPIAEWGLDIDRKQITVDTEKFETSTPGMAAFGAAPYIFPEKRILLQYTTTSPKLHKVLGVETPVFD